jgi:hypothetical protein
MKWQFFCLIPEMGVTDWPSGAYAPLARVAGFAPLSLTVDVMGERGELQVLRFAQNDNQSAIVSMLRR